jgi:K(+)-stimulated pyrophosphate-energized sodium pump
MNLVSLLIAPAVVAYGFGTDKNTPLRITISVVAALIIVAAVVVTQAQADLHGRGRPGGHVPRRSGSAPEYSRAHDRGHPAHRRVSLSA